MTNKGYQWMGEAVLALNSAVDKSNPKTSIGTKKIEFIMWLWEESAKGRTISSNRRILSEKSGLVSGPAAGISSSETLVYIFKALIDQNIIKVNGKEIELILSEEIDVKTLWIGKAFYTMLVEGKKKAGYQFGTRKADLIFWMWDNRDNIPATGTKIAEASSFAAEGQSSITVIKTIYILREHDLIKKSKDGYVLLTGKTN